MDGNTYELWLAVLAVLVSIVSWFGLRFARGWSDLRKRIAVAAVALVFGVADLWYKGALDLSNLSQTWLVVFLAATGFYQVVLRNVNGALEGGA